MAVNMEKLVKLKALKDLAERIKSECAEQNKIEKIKVNGTDQTIEEDKSVNITVPTTVSELTDGGNYAKITDVDEKINAKVSSVYKPGGSKTFEELSGLNTAENLGVVYDVTDKFETDENFVDGGGNSYPAGTNVVVVEDDADGYKFDVLSGFIDLSEYAKTSEVVMKDGKRQLSTEDFTTEYKEKLDGLSNYAHPTSEGGGSKESGLYKIATDANGHITEATAIQKEDITGLGIPKENTTYEDVEAGGKSGLMSGADKTKLDGFAIAEDAEVTEMLNEVFSSEAI